VQAGAPRALYEHPASPEAAAALGPVNRFDGVIAGGALATPFGAIAASAPDGPATAIVRAEALTFAAGGARVRVLARRPQGAFDLVLLEAGGVTWRGQALAGEGPEVGAAAHATLSPKGAFVFPR
jgi:hypothetical protein